MKTLINLVLDESGSMSSVKDDTIRGFNEYVDGLKEQGNEVSMTLTVFNTEKTEVRFADKPIAEVPHLDGRSYRPNHGTPLFDAIGKTVAELEKWQLDGTAVLFVIMTDGEENSSIEFSKEDILKLIQGKQKEGWTFAYLGADADTWDGTQAIRSQALDLGIPDRSTLTYGRRAPSAAYGKLADATCMYMAAGSRPTEDFFGGEPKGKAAPRRPTFKSTKRSR